MAQVFEKDHKHVTDKIKNLECSQLFSGSNFRLTTYHDKFNREQKVYELSRDGFARIVMGFTGAKAGRNFPPVNPLTFNVAEVFEKRHDNMLSVIRQIDEENKVVNLLAFKEIKYLDSRGREQVAFEMTETGFVSVIGRFNDRKAEIHTDTAPRPDRPSCVKWDRLFCEY